MIQLEVINQGVEEGTDPDGMGTLSCIDHFVVRGDEPWRIEIIHRAGTVIAHIYSGAETDIEQGLLGCYDGTLDKNTSWKAES